MEKHQQIFDSKNSSYLSNFCEFESTFNHLLFLAIEFNQNFRNSDVFNSDFNTGIQLLRQNQTEEANQYFIQGAISGHSKSLFFAGIQQLHKYENKFFNKRFYHDYINEYLTSSLDQGLIDAFVRICIEIMEPKQYCLLLKFAVQKKHPSAIFWFYEFFSPKIHPEIIKNIANETLDSFWSSYYSKIIPSNDADEILKYQSLADQWEISDFSLLKPTSKILEIGDDWFGF
jgi:hypothetical protein